MVAIALDLPPLYARQHDAIFEPRRISVVEASTKSGKTHGCIIWQIYQCCTIPGVHWWVAPIYNQAKIAFGRAVKYLPREVFSANKSDLTITFVNGSVWHFKSADNPDSLYGEDVASAVIDEASRVRQDSWWAVRSTLTATRGPVRIIGNTKGTGTWFYKLGLRGKSGDDPDVAHHKLTAYDAVAGGVLDVEEVEAAKRDMPEHVFRELYLAEPGEDGLNPFGLRYLKACSMPELSSAPAVAWGWDVAKSQDWTVGIGLDRWGNMCRFERWQGVSWPETYRRIASLTDAPAYLDSTSAGGSAALDGVRELRQAKDAPVEGYVFSQRSKQYLFETLATAIQAGEIGILDGTVLAECEQFEATYTRTGIRYAAPEGYGLHDDCVDALGLAWRAKLDFPAERSAAERAWNQRALAQAQQIGTPGRAPRISRPSTGRRTRGGSW